MAIHKTSHGQWMYKTKRGSYYAMDHPKVKHGKKFRTKKGKWGCYVYIGNERVHFLQTPKKIVNRRRY